MNPSQALNVSLKVAATVAKAGRSLKIESPLRSLPAVMLTGPEVLRFNVLARFSLKGSVTFPVVEPLKILSLFPRAHSPDRS